MPAPMPTGTAISMPNREMTKVPSMALSRPPLTPLVVVVNNLPEKAAMP